MPNARDLYNTDVPLFQPTNFNYSLQRVIENCVEIPSYLHALFLNQDKSEQNKLREEQLDKNKKELTRLDKPKENEGHLKTVIKKLEGEPKEQKE